MILLRRKWEHYISDNYNHRIRKINTAGVITTVAGTGGYGYNGDGIPATAAKIYSPHGIAIDGSGNLLICDDLNNRIRKVTPATGGIITTIAGTGLMLGYSGDGGPATATDIGRSYGIALDNQGNVLFSTYVYNRVCKIDVLGIISTIAGGALGAIMEIICRRQLQNYLNRWVYVLTKSVIHILQMYLTTGYEK